MTPMTRRKHSRPPPARDAAMQQNAPENRRSGEAGGGEHWLYGLHVVMAALRNRERKVTRLLTTEGCLEQHGAELTALLDERIEFAPPLHPERAGRDSIDTVVPKGAVHQGIAARVRPLIPQTVEDIPAAAPGERRMVLALDRVTDPHNVGAILRSAAVFGADAVLATDRHSPPETGVLAKSASGALDAVPLVRVGNLSRALADLKEKGYWVVGLDGAAKELLGDIKLPDAAVLVLGAEGDGARRLTLEGCDMLVRLPVAPAAAAAGIDSLNVSNAAAIALYEFARRAKD